MFPGSSASVTCRPSLTMFWNVPRPVSSTSSQPSRWRMEKLRDAGTANFATWLKRDDVWTADLTKRSMLFVKQKLKRRKQNYNRKMRRKKKKKEKNHVLTRSFIEVPILIHETVFVML
eukprot:m.98911 g.98911  ORF g.98911 m.98911 type:complete len:118 (+) comp9024_c2_seq2:461-814(+)